MRLTRAGEYAIRCIYHLATQGSGMVTKRQQIAQAMDIPDPFLGKIAQQLAQAGLIEIVQGSKGGMRLAISPHKVSMLDVIEAVIGEIFLNDCIIRPESCDRGKACVAHQVWKNARDQLRDTLAEATFDKLVDEETIFKPFCVKHIASKKMR
jgi:Rrf2 family protein